MDSLAQLLRGIQEKFSTRPTAVEAFLQARKKEEEERKARERAELAAIGMPDPETGQTPEPLPEKLTTPEGWHKSTLNLSGPIPAAGISAEPTWQEKSEQLEKQMRIPEREWKTGELEHMRIPAVDKALEHAAVLGPAIMDPVGEVAYRAVDEATGNPWLATAADVASGLALTGGLGMVSDAGKFLGKKMLKAGGKEALHAAEKKAPRAAFKETVTTGRPKTELQQLVAKDKALKAQHAKELKARTRYGLFEHRGDGRYNPADAHKTYKSQAAADKAAEKMGGNTVVRTFYLDKAPGLEPSLRQGLTPQGSGTSVLSHEELARNEKFFVVSRDGRVKTFLGQQPDASLRPGEAIVALKTDGTIRHAGGDLGAAQKVKAEDLGPAPKHAEQPDVYELDMDEAVDLNTEAKRLLDDAELLPEDAYGHMEKSARADAIKVVEDIAAKDPKAAKTLLDQGETLTPNDAKKLYSGIGVMGDTSKWNYQDYLDAIRYVRATNMLFSFKTHAVNFLSSESHILSDIPRSFLQATTAAGTQPVKKGLNWLGEKTGMPVTRKWPKLDETRPTTFTQAARQTIGAWHGLEAFLRFGTRPARVRKYGGDIEKRAMREHTGTKEYAPEFMRKSMGPELAAATHRAAPLGLLARVDEAMWAQAYIMDAHKMAQRFAEESKGMFTYGEIMAAMGRWQDFAEAPRAQRGAIQLTTTKTLKQVELARLVNQATKKASIEADHLIFTKTPMVNKANPKEAMNYDRFVGSMEGLANEEGMSPAIFNALFPFIRTPANVVKESMKHTPLGAFSALRSFSSKAYKKGTFLEAERAFHGDLSKSIIGSAAIFYGWKYGRGNGWRITGGEAQSSGEQRTAEAAGHVQRSLQVEDGEGYWSIPIERIPPIVNLLTVGADVREAIERGEISEDDAAAQIVEATAAVGEATYEIVDPYVDQFSMALDAWRAYSESGGELPKAFKKWLSDMGASYVVPAVVSQANQAFLDPIVRDPRFEEEQTTGELLTESTRQKLPGTSKGFPPRTDIFGTPMSRSPSGKLLDKLMTFMLPGTGAGYREKNPLAVELQKLGIAKDIPSTKLKMPRELLTKEIEGTPFLKPTQEPYPWSDEEYTVVKTVRGRAFQSALEKAMSMPVYQKGDLFTKRRVVMSIWNSYDQKLIENIKKQKNAAMEEGREIRVDDILKYATGVTEEDMLHIQDQSGIDIFSGRQ
jgi:hypothetical protein